MKNFFIKLSVGFSIVGILGILASSFVLGSVGSIILYSGIASGLAGLGFCAVGACYEKKEYAQKQNENKFLVEEYTPNKKEISLIDEQSFSANKSKTNTKNQEQTK